MIKGNNRRMFRKPGLARQAIGILASSKELMDEVQPVRMVAGGDAALEQNRQQLLREYLNSQTLAEALAAAPSTRLALLPDTSNTGMGIGSLPEVQMRRLSPDPATMTPLEALVDPTLVAGNIRSRIMGTNTAERPDRARILREQEQVVPPDDASSLGIRLTDLKNRSAIDKLGTSSSIISQPIRVGTEEEIDYGKLAANYSMPQPVRKELLSQRTVQQRSLKQAQNKVGQAQRAYDKAVAKNDETAMGVALSKLERARKQAEQQRLELREINKQLGQEKLTQSFGEIENINRQLGDENVSEERKQELRQQLAEARAQMEEEPGLRKFEGEKATPSDPAISFEEAEAREAAIEEQEKQDAPSPRTDAPSPAEVADKAANDAETNTGSNLSNPGEKKSAVQLYIETLLGKEKPERDPRDQKIIEEAMRGAEYDEDEIKKNIKDDAFWNAVMLTGLNMVVGSAEGGDRFSNMARSAIAGINTFNADVKEREKTAYKKFIDKQNRNLQKANLILSQEKTEADREFREFTKVVQLQAAEDMNYFRQKTADAEQQRLALSQENALLKQQGLRTTYVQDILGDRRKRNAAEDQLRETPGYEQYAPRKAKGGKNKTVDPTIPTKVLREFLENQAAAAYPNPSFAPPASGSVIVLDR